MRSTSGSVRRVATSLAGEVKVGSMLTAAHGCEDLLSVLGRRGLVQATVSGDHEVTSVALRSLGLYGDAVWLFIGQKDFLAFVMEPQ